MQGMTQSRLTASGFQLPEADLLSLIRLDQHPVTVYLARLGPGSRRAMQTALNTIAHLASQGQCSALEFPWERLGYQHTAAVRAALTQRYAPATVNKQLAALRGVLRECWRLGLMSAEAYQRAADMPAVQGQRLPRGRVVQASELQALFHVCLADTSPAGQRDRALIGVMAGSGPRRAEVVALNHEDYSPPTRGLVIRQGKGNKDRLVYVAPGVDLALQTWLEVRGPSCGPLFCPVNRWGGVVLRRLTDQAVLNILRKRALQAGVTLFSPHDLRRTFISNLLDAGVDLATVQKLAGHANVQTTTRYDRRGEAAKQAAVARLNLPI